MKKRDVTFISGGARSGKSSYALQLVENYKNKVFVATAEAFDDEMQDRIRAHREERGDAFACVETPLDPAQAFGQMPAGTEAVLIDCLTVWLGNLMHHEQIDSLDCPQIHAFLEVISDPPCDVVIVSNEVGMGIVPHDSVSRKYRDLAGALNQRVAALADQAWLVVSGIPLKLK